MKDGFDKIHGFPSQIKARRARAVDPVACGILLFKRNMLSKNNRCMAQYFAGKKELSDTALGALQNPLSDMIKDVLIDSGVPKYLIRKYKTKKIGQARERAQRKS